MDIGLYIINAGNMQIGYTETRDPKTLETMINANDYQAMSLLRQFLPGLTKRLSRTGLIMVVSIASIAPSPLNVTYHATKAMMYNIAAGVQEELKEKNANVDFMIVNPGLCETNLNNSLFKRFLIPKYVGFT